MRESCLGSKLAEARGQEYTGSHWRRAYKHAPSFHCRFRQPHAGDATPPPALHAFGFMRLDNDAQDMKVPSCWGSSARLPAQHAASTLQPDRSACSYCSRKARPSPTNMKPRSHEGKLASRYVIEADVTENGKAQRDPFRGCSRPSKPRRILLPQPCLRSLSFIHFVRSSNTGLLR